MSDWYHTKDGQQKGPVPFEMLRELASSGQLQPDELVWSQGLKDWTPAADVAGLFPPAKSDAPLSDPANPYASPATTWSVPPEAAGPVPAEIEPGSDPLLPTECIKRAGTLTLRELLLIFLTGLIFTIITLGTDVLLGTIDRALGWEMEPVVIQYQKENGGWVRLPPGAPLPTQLEEILRTTELKGSSSIPHMVISNVLELFLSLGCTRVGLNLVTGKRASLEMIFGEGGKLIRALIASLLYSLMVGVGLVLFIVPGVYLAMRFGQFRIAIVDRDLGILESFRYSSRITRNNRLSLFLLLILSFLLLIAGFCALCVGILVALPIVWLAEFVAYRWMQYGHQAAMDKPGTEQPSLSDI